MQKNKIDLFNILSGVVARWRLWVIVFLIVTIVMVAGILLYARAQSQAIGHGAGEVTLTVVPGENVFTIANDLFRRDVIASPTFFVAYAYVKGLANHFQAGTYRIDSAFSVESLARMLAQGPPEISVLIPPGATLKEIDDILTRDGVISAGALEKISPDELRDAFPFLARAKTMEGFLMPDTYSFYLNQDPHAVARTMVQNFSDQTKSLLGAASPEATMRLVTIASLLEKEVVSDHDKAMVAGVIQNRLADGMPLQIDAAVLYGACDGVFVGCPAISVADIAQETPYNTYRLRGLPPTPISNPTLSSLQAAAHPIIHRYLYYLSDPKTGATIFSVTLAQHARNRQMYLGSY
jgi:UPF0755 protein